MATRRIANEPALPVIDAIGTPGWVEAIPESRRKHLRRWLWTGAVLTASTLFIGGVTRLTESGLSIVDWDPIVGAVPPITPGDWQEAFSRYQQYSEYVKIRPDMTLGEFKYIYFWEYLHRNIGRLLGVVFLIPFILFWIRGYFNGPLLRRVLLLFALGGLQGLMGWYMVSSGLVDRPDVSQIRLATHLLLAVTIFGCCIWFANDLRSRRAITISLRPRELLRKALLAIGALLGIQIFWGGLVAGLKAGLSFATFPLMDGSLLPPNGWKLNPIPVNLVENPATVQWMHRLLATLLLAGVIALFAMVRRSRELRPFRTWSAAMMGVILVQYALGVATLLSHVLIGLAIIHQLVALLAVGVLLTFLHRVMRSNPYSGLDHPIS